LAKYYVLAKGMKPLPRANDFQWPYEVAICFEAVSRPIGFSEGVGHGQAGGIFSAEEALAPTWKDHFSKAGGEWLLPFVRELAEGRSVPAEGVIKMYRELNGFEPQSYECNFS
jgi:hypothetical protein